MSWERKTAQALNDETDPLWIPKGKFTISIAMSDTAGVTVYRNTEDNSKGRKTPGAASVWNIVGEEKIADTEELGDEGAGAWYKLKCTTFTAADVQMNIGE